MPEGTTPQLGQSASPGQNSRLQLLEMQGIVDRISASQAEQKTAAKKANETSIYWDEPKVDGAFPFLRRETVPFPRHICGKEVNPIVFLLGFFVAGTAITIIVVAAAVNFRGVESTVVYKFLNNANTAYVGGGGLAFFVCMLIAWSTITGYFLLRTGDIDLFGFFHLLGPPGLGLMTLGIFTDDLGDAYWDGPKEDAGTYYTLAIFIPAATLGFGYLMYILVSKNFQSQVLCDTVTHWYGGAVPVTILKFAFAGVMEEVGWSGVLFPQMLHATESYTLASFLCGLIWGLWHIPLVVGGGYNNNISPLWAAFVMPWMTTPWAFFHMWLRVRSWSIWPVFIAHVAHNCWIELIFDPMVGRSEYRGFSKFARKKRAHYFVGEFGFLGALSYMICAIVFIIDVNQDYINE